MSDPEARPTRCEICSKPVVYVHYRTVYGRPKGGPLHQYCMWREMMYPANRYPFEEHRPVPTTPAEGWLP